MEKPMSKSKKILIGVLSILPVIFFALYFFSFISMMFFERGPVNQDGGPAISFLISILMAIIGTILTLVMTIYHVIYISKSTTMNSSDKLVWILVVVLLNWIGDIIFWYVKIWKEPKSDAEKSSFQ
jgi:hypothetical protein